MSRIDLCPYMRLELTPARWPSRWKREEMAATIAAFLTEMKVVEIVVTRRGIRLDVRFEQGTNPLLEARRICVENASPDLRDEVARCFAEEDAT